MVTKYCERVLGRFYIQKSDDGGCNYETILEPDDLEFLEQVGEVFDKDMSRWVIFDKAQKHINFNGDLHDAPIVLCQLFKSILGFIESFKD